jgi:hypothetical protein
LSKRKALILSLIYCGLGQIYKGDKTKGIIFIALYSLIIVLFAFFSSFSLLIRLFVLSILILMWLMGMIDAYIEENTDDEAVLGKKRVTIWHKLLNAMEIIVICGVVITIVMATFPGFGEKSATQAKKPKAEQKVEIKAEDKLVTGKFETEIKSDESVFFSIQVGAFASARAAKKVHDQLRRKGYQVRLESPSSTGDKLHRILIGKFSTEQHATWVGEELKKREGISYVIVERKVSGD